MTPLDRAAQLTNVADVLARGELLPGATAAWLAEAFRQYLHEAAAGMTLEDALGLAPSAPGEEHWTTTHRRHRRNAAIRAMRARAPFADLKLTEAAREISTLGCRLQHVGRTAQQPLAVDEETKTLLDEAIRTGHKFPGPKQIQSILEIK